MQPTTSKDTPMSTPAYAVAVLTDVEPGPAITEYLARIDATLDLHGGQFLVHGGAAEPLEGKWAGLPIVIRFPDADAAHGWYQSPEYQAILPLRLDHSRGVAAILPGVPRGYRAADLLAGQPPVPKSKPGT